MFTEIGVEPCVLVEKSFSMITLLYIRNHSVSCVSQMCWSPAISSSMYTVPGHKGRNCGQRRLQPVRPEESPGWCMEGPAT